jgi:hypothetical protein
MWLRAVRNHFLIRGVTVVLAVMVCGGSLDWGHVGGDDPDCNVVLVLHNHAAHRLSAAPLSSTSGDHCFICHSLRLLHVGFAARHERVSIDVRSTDYRDQHALVARLNVTVDLSSRAPPSVRL